MKMIKVKTGTKIKIGISGKPVEYEY